MLIDKKQAEEGISLAWLVLAVILIATALVVTSIIIFFNSGAYSTIKQISAATNTLTREDLKDYDTTSPIQSDDIIIYAESLPKRVEDFDDNKDFDQNAISQEVLGY